MAEVLAQYPEVKATFNFVPSLVEQLLEYAQGEAVDRALALSRQETWSEDDKAYLLSFFFNVNWERVIRRYPRYSQLLLVVTGQIPERKVYLIKCGRSMGAISRSEVAQKRNCRSPKKPRKKQRLKFFHWKHRSRT
jgi:alpha-amylase/alpha-mannosidase (GH57 family)